eukprot:4126168-Prymnesium_polylepis.1
MGTSRAQIHHLPRRRSSAAQRRAIARDLSAQVGLARPRALHAYHEAAAEALAGHCARMRHTL